MTERLRTLLLDEADRLDVPPAPTADTLDRGRALVSRRRWTAGRAAAAVLVVAAAGTAGAISLHGSSADPVAPAEGSGTVRLAFSVGDTVFTGGGSVRAAMPEIPQTLYYTSAGVLVRTNASGSSDGGAPFHFELVADDGTVTKLGVTLGEVVPSTDPIEPYLVWAEKQDGGIQVVVHDVATDQDVARVDVPGTFTWGGWAAPPVSLDGDTVYVATDGVTRTVDWRTGEVGTSDVLPAETFPDVHGGRTVSSSGTTAKVEDVATGSTALNVPTAKYAQVDLSPDGRFVTVSANEMGPVQSFEVYDVATGAHRSFYGQPFAWGWTTDGRLFQVTGSRLTTCDAASGVCSRADVPVTPRDTDKKDPINVRMAGHTYES